MIKEISVFLELCLNVHPVPNPSFAVGLQLKIILVVD